MNGTEYQIDVALPDSYADSSRRYPVLYSLVPEHFDLLTISYRLVREGNLIPQDVILVAIGYPGWEYGSWSDATVRTRERDFGITDALAARPAGAVAFLNVLRHDLIPLIDSTYRTTPDRGLVGIEQAGVFAIYTLLHEADLFQRYIIGSPAIDLGPDWADPSTFKWEAEYAASHRDLAARVYMFVGGGVDTWATLSRPPAEQFWSRLKARRYANLDLTTEVFSREGISSVNLPAMDRALRAIYNPRSVSLGDAARRSYVGDWRSDSGDVITLRLVDNHLVLFVPPVRRLRNTPKQILASELSAETDTSFFGRGSSLERMTSLVFHRESKAGPATSLVLRQAGAKPVVYRRVRVK